MTDAPSLFDNAQTVLPANFAGWFSTKGWSPHPHQLEMVRMAQAGQHVLLVAPTGAGKTLAGFLPSLIELSERPRPGLHTLYLSPLKALAVDIQRNLEQPVAELRLPVRAETRTGDTPQNRRQRQRRNPPSILMTTPESLSLMLSFTDARRIFGGVRCVIIDELHAVVDNKRGELLALALARLARLAPRHRRVGLSATVAHPDALRAYLSPSGRYTPGTGDVALVRGRAGAAPQVDILTDTETMPWGGHMGLHTLPAVYERIRTAGTTLIFVNTRAQAELVFQGLWRINEDNLPIALHHGSLAVEQRRRVEAAMTAGGLRAVVATSSLDLGIDWADIDLVVQIGAPKGVSRLMQRIGRANHRLDEPSKAVLVPANRFETFECQAAIDAVDAGELDGDPPRPGGLDVLAQHLLGMVCSEPAHPAALYDEIRSAAPYAALDRKTFDAVFDYVATGGFALRAYDQYARLTTDDEGRFKPANAMVPRRYRINVGTIVEETTLKVRLNRGAYLGEIEEYFIQMLAPGDTFIFAGRLLRFVAVKENTALCVLGGEGEPKVPAYAGGFMPLSTNLADRVRGLLAAPDRWRDLPPLVHDWLDMQRWRSELPSPHGVLVESFPHRGREFLVIYCFEGRNAHQTLGLLLTKRMERAKLKPVGFVATDYVLATWSLKAPTAAQIRSLLDQDMLGDDLEDWMADSTLLRRTFRRCAVIAGLIERRQPGQEKTGKQITISSDLIYDVLRRHQPDHILLRATRDDAARGLTDIRRISDLLARAGDAIRFRRLDRISPLAVPIVLEVGREWVDGVARDDLLEEAADELVSLAMPDATRPDPLPSPQGELF